MIRTLLLDSTICWSHAQVWEDETLQRLDSQLAEKVS